MRVFGIIGYPLTHSFSPAYFSDKFKKTGIIDAEYRAFPLVSIEEFTALLASEKELCGLNVTVPYKEKIIPFLDELSDEAEAIGAVNTITIGNRQQAAGNKKRFLRGFNTDAFGFRQSIKPFLASHHYKALVLGTGGASKAVCYVLKEIGIDVTLVSRKKIHGNITYADLSGDIIASHCFIINTTPAGMHPDDKGLPPLPENFFKAIGTSHFLYDLIYNPSETIFLQKGKEKGALIQNGLSMLHQQAEESWRIWNS